MLNELVNILKKNKIEGILLVILVIYALILNNQTPSQYIHYGLLIIIFSYFTYELINRYLMNFKENQNSILLQIYYILLSSVVVISSFKINHIELILILCLFIGIMTLFGDKNINNNDKKTKEEIKKSEDKKREFMYSLFRL